MPTLENVLNILNTHIIWTINC